jgi:hypothetical protein
VRLTNAAVDFKINQNNSGSQEPQPIVNQLMIGQLNASVPVFLVSKYKIVSKFMRTYMRLKWQQQLKLRKI